MGNYAVKLKNISKKYTVRHEKPSLIDNIFGRKTQEEFGALRRVNLKIKEGDRVGITGPNGAGKTTLLKIIAGITVPTTGSVETSGKVVSLIDLQAGFHPELTGEENILLNAMLTGMSPKEVRERKGEIVEFADLGTFIDAPFYTYSDGMKFRLAFSVAVHSLSDIILIDEIYITGDREFQRKSMKAIKDAQSKGKKLTTVVCAHRPAFIWSLSDVFYEIKKGKIRKRRKDQIRKEMLKDSEAWRKDFGVS